MNLKLFDKLMERRPSQHLPEWRLFLELCELYMKKRGITKPIVVELGIWNNYQKKFYEQLLGAEHIGINITKKRSVPDIQGNTRDPWTLGTLKKRLDGRAINILFIDADHHYEAVKKDFELYAPLCADIVAIHDIVTKSAGVHRFWDELREAAMHRKEYKDFLFVSINQRHFRKGLAEGPGIGMIIKR